MEKLSKYLPLTNQIDEKIKVDADFNLLLGDRLFYMGREVMVQEPGGELVPLRVRLGFTEKGTLHFENLDRYDYRRANLRVGPQKARKQSRYKGVSWHEGRRSWRAGGKYFPTERAAVEYLLDKKCPARKVGAG